MIAERAINERPVRSPVWMWLAPAMFVLLIGMYFVGRFEGRWAEADTTSFAQYMRSVQLDGSLTPGSYPAYPNGYGFQAVSTFVLAMTGVSVKTLQQLIYPLLASLVVIPAWLLFREWTGSARGALIGSILLFIQPEFLFVVLRSSHEKFTRALLLICLYLLTRSFKLRDRPWEFALHVGLFYLSAYGLIASNNLLAHSFIFAVGSALVLMYLVERRTSVKARPDSHMKQRLPYAVAICLGLSYLFTFQFYPPAQHDLLVLHNVWQRLAALFLDVQFQRTNPYNAVQAGWISLPVYFVLSLANWIILGVSVVIWMRQGWRWFRHNDKPYSPTAVLIWLFYAAFALQGVITVFADASGALGGNLQHRVFSSFVMVAVGLVAVEINRINLGRGWMARFVVAGSIASIAILSAFKATNEPLLSNKWTFYRTSELEVVQWGDKHLSGTQIWTEFDERLNAAYALAGAGKLDEFGVSDNRNTPVGGRQIEFVRYFVITDVSRTRSARLEQAFPVPADALQIYDNGSAELYHTRPQTPFQK